MVCGVQFVHGINLEWEGYYGSLIIIPFVSEKNRCALDCIKPSHEA